MSHQILIGDVRNKLKELPEQSIQTCITSPPYWGLRDYGNDGQIGLEQTPDEYIIEMVNVFREVWRVLKDDGTVWLNLGDSYSGSGKGPAGNLGSKHNERHLENKHSAIVPQGLKPKDLIGIPWKVAFALQADGWYLRQDIIWAKPNPMPESVQDRCTRSHEYLFLLTKSAKYYFDNQAIKEDAVTGSWDKLPPIGGKKHQENGNPTYSGNQPASDGKRNKRDVWTINTKPFKGAHFAVMPEALVEPCILAGSRGGDLVLDPFTGSGTVGVVAKRHNRNFVGVELNPEYAQIAEERIGVDLFD
jgi:DNA modification methylase